MPLCPAPLRALGPRTRSRRRFRCRRRRRASSSLPRPAASVAFQLLVTCAAAADLAGSQAGAWGAGRVRGSWTPAEITSAPHIGLGRKRNWGAARPGCFRGRETSGKGSGPAVSVFGFPGAGESGGVVTKMKWGYSKPPKVLGIPEAPPASACAEPPGRSSGPWKIGFCSRSQP